MNKSEVLIKFICQGQTEGNIILLAHGLAMLIEVAYMWCAHGDTHLHTPCKFIYGN